MAQATAQIKDISGFIQYTRGGGAEIQTPYEKPVVVPNAENQDPSAHAWTDARFAFGGS